MTHIPLSRSERLRRKALALRQIASDLRSSTSRALVLSLAADYELLASNAEAAEALAMVEAVLPPPESESDKDVSRA
jgi:hypothetical protein